MKFLYHYTTIESLSLILRNRTIRFNSLNNLDDAQESMTNSPYNYTRFFFVSSWIDEKHESIPMWKMYSSLTGGVRIKLPVNPFKEYPDYTELRYNQDGSIDNLVGKKAWMTCFPMSEFLRIKSMILPASQKDLLKKVEYTEDLELLYPQLVINNTEDVIKLGRKIGIHKSKLWDFQNEWRYIMYLVPVDFHKFFGTPNLPDITVEISKNYNDNNYVLPFSDYYLEISDEAFSMMELTLSPIITPGNRITVESLKDKFNPNMSILDSELKDKLRR